VSAALDDESYARAALTYLAEPGDLRLGALVRDCGAASTLAAIKAGEFPDLASPGAATARVVRRWRVRLAEVPSPDEVVGFCRAGIRARGHAGP
jgi:DNA processing protein